MLKSSFSLQAVALLLGLQERAHEIVGRLARRRSKSSVR